MKLTSTPTQPYNSRWHHETHGSEFFLLSITSNLRKFVSVSSHNNARNTKINDIMSCYPLLIAITGYLHRFCNQNLYSSLELVLFQSMTRPVMRAITSYATTDQGPGLYPTNPSAKRWIGQGIEQLELARGGWIGGDDLQNAKLAPCAKALT